MGTCQFGLRTEQTWNSCSVDNVAVQLCRFHPWSQCWPCSQRPRSVLPGQQRGERLYCAEHGTLCIIAPDELDAKASAAARNNKALMALSLAA
jgi:hypothetical protein